MKVIEAKVNINIDEAIEELSYLQEERYRHLEGDSEDEIFLRHITALEFALDVLRDIKKYNNAELVIKKKEND